MRVCIASGDAATLLEADAILADAILLESKFLLLNSDDDRGISRATAACAKCTATAATCTQPIDLTPLLLTLRSRRDQVGSRRIELAAQIVGALSSAPPYGRARA